MYPCAEVHHSCVGVGFDPVGMRLHGQEKQQKGLETVVGQ